MVHILFFSLKIIGIILLVIFALCLLILFFPVTYRAKGSIDGKDYAIDLKCGWLFHLLHFRGKLTKEEKIAKLRILGIPINLLKDETDSLKDEMSKEKKKKEKSSSQKKSHNKTATKDKIDKSTVKVPDEIQQKDVEEEKETDKLIEEKKPICDKIKDIFERICSFFKKTKEKIKSAFKNVEDAYNKAKEIKAFITANTTKEAYQYGKKIIIKVVKHIFPSKIRANIHFGFEEPDKTGQMLGYIAMTLSMFRINVKHVLVVPNFDKKVVEGNIKAKGHFLIGVLLINGLRFYFKKEIHDIIKKFS